MKDCISCLTVQDPGNLTQPGHHVKDSIPIWTRGGKILINPESYMNAVETFKPDMYYLLSDGDTNISSSAKRVSKAVDRTLMFINQCLMRHNKSPILKDTFVMAPISGGYCLKARERCIMDILRDHEVIGGFLIDGLHNNGPEVEFLEFREVKEIVEFVIVSLPLFTFYFFVYLFNVTNKLFSKSINLKSKKNYLIQGVSKMSLQSFTTCSSEPFSLKRNTKVVFYF